MITPAPLIAAAARRLHHRSFRDADGIRMISQDGQRAAWLTKEQYDALASEFADAMRPINKRTKWGFALYVPVTILTLAVIHRLDLGTIVDDWGVPSASFVAILVTLTWWPSLVVTYYWMNSRRVASLVETRLARLPAAPLPTGRPTGFQTLEIIALFFVGPGLLIDMIGSLLPHAFDHTPLMGRTLGLQSLVGLAIFAVLAGRRLFNHRPDIAPAQLASAPEASTSTARIARMAARARTETVSK